VACARETRFKSGDAGEQPDGDQAQFQVSGKRQLIPRQLRYPGTTIHFMPRGG
jgi:hypothetical protein